MPAIVPYYYMLKINQCLQEEEEGFSFFIYLFLPVRCSLFAVRWPVAYLFITKEVLINTSW